MNAPTGTRGLVLVAHDRTDTQGVADSVVKYLRRDHGYEVVVVGPGQSRAFAELSAAELAQARFFLELDAVSGVLYHTEGLESLSCPKLAWFIDTHKKPHFHQRSAVDFDVVFHAMRAWGGLFGERGRWLPVHYDAELVAPREGAVPTHDVAFVGSRPRERTEALQEIARRHGLTLLLETTTGPREKELTADLYARCRIVFNQHVANDMNFRTVEAQACRRLLVTDAQRNGQYELFRDREHVVYYKDYPDLERVLLHYLRHPDERERIAAAGHALVSERHTTAARVREIVAVAEGLVAERVRAGAPAVRTPAAARRPRVSIGVVCCDRPELLETTLESTRQALSAFSSELEWLAFDNGSTPAVRRVLEDAGIDLVLRSRRNRGLAPALDALYRESQGDLILTLEDDWRCLARTPEWLELAVAVLDTQPDVGLVRLRKRDDNQCGHWKRHRYDVALRHHPWSIRPIPAVVETREVGGQPVFVASAEYVNWTNNPTLCRREVRDWIGPMAAYLPDPRDHRPRDGVHPGLEGAIDRRWRSGPWKVAKLIDGPYTHIGDDQPARVEVGP